MDKKLSRIASFIESLPVDESMEDCRLAVLPTEMSQIGADNGGNCQNYLREQCYKGKNEANCVNYDGVCGKSENKGSCKSLPANDCLVTVKPGHSNDGPLP